MKQKSESTEISSSQIFWERFIENKFSLFGLILFSIILFAILFLPFLIPYGRDEINYALSFSSPSFTHPLGTDELGRDILVRILHGGRISLLVGFIATLISVIIACIIGGIAGFYGGIVDFLCMRFTEIVSSFPFLPFALTLSATFGAQVAPEFRMYIITTILGLLGWTGLARIIRGQILSLKEQEFMLAARALGISNRRQIFNHLLPNTFTYIIVSATLSIASFILTEAGLSFLGLGVVQPVPTWGNMIQAAQNSYTLSNRPWVWISPGVAILLTVLSINIIGESLRDTFDPKNRA